MYQDDMPTRLITFPQILAIFVVHLQQSEPIGLKSSLLVFFDVGMHDLCEYQNHQSTVMSDTLRYADSAVQQYQRHG